MGAEHDIDDAVTRLLEKLEEVQRTHKLSDENMLKLLGRRVGGDVEDMYFNWLAEGED